MARPLPPPPLLIAWPLVEELFFAASLIKNPMKQKIQMIKKLLLLFLAIYFCI